MLIATRPVSYILMPLSDISHLVLAFVPVDIMAENRTLGLLFRGVYNKRQDTTATDFLDVGINSYVVVHSMIV